jgi:hypothetical protein
MVLASLGRGRVRMTWRVEEVAESLYRRSEAGDVAGWRLGGGAGVRLPVVKNWTTVGLQLA